MLDSGFEPEHLWSSTVTLPGTCVQSTSLVRNFGSWPHLVEQVSSADHSPTVQLNSGHACVAAHARMLDSWLYRHILPLLRCMSAGAHNLWNMLAQPAKPRPSNWQHLAGTALLHYIPTPRIKALQPSTSQVRQRGSWRNSYKAPLWTETSHSDHICLNIPVRLTTRQLSN
eukprot:CAMPEP_0197707906 /NCGR_PEP_ID=MMETSP1338-20131121/127686_1 /TAXON_ID=43686 ORGANISM="Pelagodinium beii, Strain RCC1491" /NCGR_SAMPLE_ID=MMETSP1338 /ASSEMBLY_ACC=CAM_ASM_000754 /LENGTH=170 /DNA_ID=CAMNT_0043291833 /DNA_START=1227 /DNA_END=1739 /DNA_ORIENTATION=+